jgi:hypothetical protein
MEEETLSQDSNTSFEELMDNLNDPEKVQKATTKKVDVIVIYKKLKQHYHKISHDDYYSAKNKLDQNVELKKSFRDEIRKIELVKDKATLTDEEEIEVMRINDLLENQGNVPEKERIILEKINEIENALKELKILTLDAFQ